MNYLKKLQQSDEFEYCEGATAEEIQIVETSLGVLLPKAYVKFLSECGSCNFGDTYINGVYKEDGTVTIISCGRTHQTVERRTQPPR